MDLVATKQFQVDILGDMVTAVTGSLVGAEIHLFTNDYLPTGITVIADMTEATYSGYAAEAITWLAVSSADDGTIEVIGTAGEFRPTDDVVPNQCYGFWIENGAGVLLAAGRFDAPPIPMIDALDALILTPRIRVTPTGIASVVS